MALFSQSLDHVARNLRELTLSQKAAIFMGVLLVCGSLAWLAQWAATPDMVPLVSRDMTSDEVAEVRQGLDSMRETYKVVGSKVMVPATSNRGALWAQLQQMNRMPGDVSQDFSDIIKQSNPWLSQDENDKRWTLALQTELAKVLRQMDGVKDAKVFLNLNRRDRGFSRSAAESTASVTLFMKSGEPVTRGLALSAARMVSGAMRGLPTRNVEVVDGAGRSALEWENEAGDSASSLQRLQKQIERETAEKITRQLDFDRSVRVNVQAVLEASTVAERTETPIEGVEVLSNRRETTSTRGRSAGQPGVEPNVGASVGGGGSDVESEKSETTESKLQHGMSTKTSSKPSGTATQISAAISISHTYLSSVLKRRKPDGKEPAEAEIQKEFDAQKTRIENLVAKLVLPQDARQVAVDWYYDVAEPEQAAPASSIDSTMALASRYGPASGLAILALAALAMMMRVAKHAPTAEAFGMEIGLPKEAIDVAKRAAADIQSRAGAAGGPHIAGGTGHATARPGRDMVELGEGADVIPVPMGQAAEGVLEAQEIDEGVLAISNMIEQVDQMVNADDEGAAALVEKWVDATDR